MRQLLPIAVILLGCGQPAQKRPEPVHVAAVAPVVIAAPPRPAPVAAAGPAVNAPDIGCAAPTCAFHAGTATYFTCLKGGEGACFHFGAACTPPEACMFDPADRVYKQCSNAVEGKCSAWGAACAPATKCMFDPQSGLHHHCDAPTGGTCRAFGALCAP